MTDITVTSIRSTSEESVAAACPGSGKSPVRSSGRPGYYYLTCSVCGAEHEVGFTDLVLPSHGAPSEPPTGSEDRAVERARTAGLFER